MIALLLGVCLRCQVTEVSDTIKIKCVCVCVCAGRVSPVTGYIGHAQTKLNTQQEPQAIRRCHDTSVLRFSLHRPRHITADQPQQRRGAGTLCGISGGHVIASALNVNLRGQNAAEWHENACNARLTGLILRINGCFSTEPVGAMQQSFYFILPLRKFSWVFFFSS